MRFVTLMIFLAACSDSPSKPDAQTAVVDGKLVDSPRPVDAAVDAMPDATPMNIQTACMHACDAIGVCLMEPVDPDCYAGCGADLGDCTAQQVQAVDDCRTEACGDFENDPENSPLLNCIMAVTCVDM